MGDRPDGIKQSVDDIASEVEAIADDVDTFVGETVKTEKVISDDLAETTRATRLLLYIASGSIVVCSAVFVLRKIFSK